MRSHAYIQIHRFFFRLTKIVQFVYAICRPVKISSSIYFSRFKLWPKWFSDYDQSNTDQLSCHSELNTNRAKPIISHLLSRFYRLWNAALADTSLLVVAKSPISFSIMTYAINARSNVLKIESNQLEKSLEWKKTKPGGVQLPVAKIREPRYYNSGKHKQEKRFELWEKFAVSAWA